MPLTAGGLLALALLLQEPVAALSSGVEGKGSPTVTIPRIESTAQIDGALDEPAWKQAARLIGFSQYAPSDGRPAEEQTEVLVWYAPDALYFGIIAHDREPGSIRATVAKRDDIDGDDNVTIVLDTFNDHRRAFFFASNPLGAQQDGVMTEGAGSDRSPDYQFDSKGRLSEDGYVIEMRIPFKSLRYPGNGPQKWGLNILRQIKRTGYEDTWTDVRRGSSSFLAQSGAIDGLHDLRRGVVTEIQPVITTEVNGSRHDTGRFEHDAADLNPGVNARIGLTNVSLNATIKPDFSQVESDASLVTVNERFALFFPEKRPFFLEGLELFATPNLLVYTRQIGTPLGGGKVTGKIGGATFAYLNAVDDADGHHALFNVTRVRRDLGKSSFVGITYTDRSAPDNTNRVLAADMRMYFRKLYFLEGQAGGSWSNDTGVRSSAPLWRVYFDRTGRSFGFGYLLNGVGSSFITRTGFVPRNDNVTLGLNHRVTWLGKPGAAIENFTIRPSNTRIWTYSGFGRTSPIEGSDGATLQMNLRGGWFVQNHLERSFVRFDRAAYANDVVAARDGATMPFVVPPGLFGLWENIAGLYSPTLAIVNAYAEVINRRTAIFPEASAGYETRVSFGIGLRPTNSIRLSSGYTYSHLTRARDHSEFARTLIPRLQVEYQPTRSFFVRMITEYVSSRQSPLVDPRSGLPLFAGSSRLDRDAGSLHQEWLVSYEPTPGTAVFVGYATSQDANRLLNTGNLERTADRFFVKLAYQFRR